MKKILCVLMFLMVSPSASATVIEVENPSLPYQQWIDEAKIPTPETTIRLIEVSGEYFCSPHAACTIPTQRTIWIDPSFIFPKQAFYHEIGHDMDVLYMPEWMRARFLSIFHLSYPWRSEAGDTSNSPKELFAEVYSQCAYKPVVKKIPMGRGIFWEANPIGGKEKFNKICRMLKRL